MITFILTFFVSFSIAQSQKAERLVNEHLIKTQKRIEIKGQKKEVELNNEKPWNVRADQEKTRQPEPLNLQQERGFDEADLLDRKDSIPMENDPVNQVETVIRERRNLANESESITNEEFIRKFQENAEKAGLKLQVDPNTYRVKQAK